jgi:hypothetical protein
MKTILIANCVAVLAMTVAAAGENTVLNRIFRCFGYRHACVYQKLKLGRSGDEVRLGWQVT